LATIALRYCGANGVPRKTSEATGMTTSSALVVRGLRQQARVTAGGIALASVHQNCEALVAVMIGRSSTGRSP
jgi:hypothetical protein